jgi:hypothetical protein
MILPRAFPLVDIVGRASPKKLSTAVPQILKKLEANQGRLRDYRMEHDLTRWLE